MKKLLTILLFIAAITTTVRADNFLVLEALITSHKTLSNQLRARTAAEAAVTVATKTTSDETDSYKGIITDLQNRVEGAFSNVQFVADLAVLTNMAVKTADMCTDGIGRAIDQSLKHPILLPYADYAVTSLGVHINGIYKLIAMVVTSGTGVVLATNEDRTQFCFMIRTKLQEIQNIARELKMMAYRCEMFGGIEQQEVQGVIDILKGSKMEEARDKAVDILSKAAAKL